MNDRLAKAILEGGCAFLMIGLPLATALGAACLREAVRVFNSFVGKRRETLINLPSFKDAAFIVLPTGLASMAISLIFTVVIVVKFNSASADRTAALTIAAIIQVFICLGIFATIASKRLRIEFNTALVIGLCYLGIATVICIVIGGFVYAALAFSGLLP